MEQKPIPKTLSPYSRRMIEYGLFDFVSLETLPEPIIAQTKPNVESFYAMVLCKVVCVVKCQKLDKELDNFAHVRFANGHYKTFKTREVDILQKNNRGKYDTKWNKVDIKQALGSSKLWFPGCAWNEDKPYQNIIAYPNFDLYNQKGEFIGNLADSAIFNYLERYCGFEQKDIVSGKYNVFFDSYNPHIEKEGAKPDLHYTSFNEFRIMAIMWKAAMMKKAKMEAEKLENKVENATNKVENNG